MGVSKKFGDDRAGSLAALVAYDAFFSLFPLLLVLVTVLGLLLSGNPELRARVLESALAQFPVLGDELEANVGSLDGSGVALTIGLFGALWAGMGAMQAAQQAMNAVWDVPLRDRPNFLGKRLRALGMLAVLGGGVVSTTLVANLPGSGGRPRRGDRADGGPRSSSSPRSTACCTPRSASGCWCCPGSTAPAPRAARAGRRPARGARDDRHTPPAQHRFVDST